MTHSTTDTALRSLSRPPLAVQILAIIGFTAFAIPVSIIAMDQFGVLGLFLAAFLAYQWTQLAGMGTRAQLTAAVKALKPQVEDITPTSSGNASFDAYRTELLARLKQEQVNFEGFLSRLRDAKDKSEFDTFLTERDSNAHAAAS
ncbi:MAG: DUF2852 domain-containing protein [Pseudomonadota bacterium]